MPQLRHIAEVKPSDLKLTVDFVKRNPEEKPEAIRDSQAIIRDIKHDLEIVKKQAIEKDKRVDSLKKQLRIEQSILDSIRKVTPKTSSRNRFRFRGLR